MAKRVAGSSIELSGPFFEKDTGKVIDENVQAMMAALASEGEKYAQSRTPHKTGATRGGITGRVQSLGGRKWHQTAVVSQQYVYPWPGGGSKQYRGGKLEAKVHMFRQTASKLRAAISVVRADLTKGLN